MGLYQPFDGLDDACPEIRQRLPMSPAPKVVATLGQFPFFRKAGTDFVRRQATPGSDMDFT